MRLLKIPKKSGGSREIYSPSKKEKEELRLFLPILRQLCIKYVNLNVCHAFLPFRSPVTNAKLHIAKNYTFSLDIKDFFDTVRPEMIEEYLNDITFVYPEKPMILDFNRDIKNLVGYYPRFTKQDLINRAFVKGNDGLYRAGQGLNTSPYISALASIKMVEEIRQYILNKNKELEEDIVFTIYADDICLSFNKYETYSILKQEVPLIVEKYFKVNPKKFRLQTSKYGRRITGVNVTDKKIDVSREIKRRIRVLEHKLKVEGKIVPIINPDGGMTTIKKDMLTSKDRKRMEKELASLKEWKKLKVPRQNSNHTILVLKYLYNVLKAKDIMANNIDPTNYDNNYNRIGHNIGDAMNYKSYGVTPKQYLTDLNELIGLTSSDPSAYSQKIREFIKRLYSAGIVKPSDVRSINDQIQKDHYDNNINVNDLRKDFAIKKIEKKDSPTMQDMGIF